MSIKHGRSESLENGLKEKGLKPGNVAQVAREIGPSMLAVTVMLSLIFGGCCSNVMPYSVTDFG